MNINLIHGDPYGGRCSLEQYFAWRPLRISTIQELQRILALVYQEDQDYGLLKNVRIKRKNTRYVIPDEFVSPLPFASS